MRSHLQFVEDLQSRPVLNTDAADQLENFKLNLERSISNIGSILVRSIARTINTQEIENMKKKTKERKPMPKRRGC